MRWVRLRRAQSQDSTKLRSFRLPTQLSQRLDDRAKLEVKTVTDIVVRALDNLLSIPSVSSEQSEVMRLSRQVKEFEVEVERLQSEEAYADAKELLEIVCLPSINWTGGNALVRLARHAGTNKALRITKQDYDEWVKDKAVNERIVSEYDQRIAGLKDKIGLLKAEIVKPGVHTDIRNT